MLYICIYIYTHRRPSDSYCRTKMSCVVFSSRRLYVSFDTRDLAIYIGRDDSSQNSRSVDVADPLGGCPLRRYGDR